MNRFCWKWGIASGVEFIGYINIPIILFELILYTVVELYSYISLIILPIVCLLNFISMQKKDTTRKRRRQLLVQLVCFVMLDCFMIAQLTQARVLHQKELRDKDMDDHCYEKKCTFGHDPWFQLSVAFTACRIIWQVYALLILRQHWLNKRDGRGDARQYKKKQLPDYIQTQTDWVSELTQDHDYKNN